MTVEFDRTVTQRMTEHMTRLTSGTVSLETLRKLGHPYGRGRGRISSVMPFRSGGRMRKARVVPSRGSVPLLPINKQSGRGQRSWRVIRTGNGYRMQFTDRGINFRIRGTRKMVASGFWTAMKRLYRLEQSKILAAKRREESR